MVSKSEGSWRPCGDYRHLNIINATDHYLMPNITDITNSIGSAHVFTKLDLLKGYFQVPVHPADVPKTAIITPFGSYAFHYPMFGLKNSDATYSQLPHCLIYMDNLLVLLDNKLVHELHFGEVISLLRENGLIVRPDKCTFAAPTVDFLS